MEEFKNKIIFYENSFNTYTYIKGKGDNKVIITAPHTMIQYKEDGIKLNEPYTKAIAMYVANKTNSGYLIKNKDTGIDSNHSEQDEFKDQLLELIKEKKTNLILDIHGAKNDRVFDVELGNLSNLSSDFSVVRELEDAFNEQGFNNIVKNDPFKGGSITKTIYENTDCDIIQVEINGKYRTIDNIEGIKSICDALINFINQYNDIVK